MEMARPNAKRRIFLIMEGKSLYIIIKITSMKFVGTPEPNSLISFFLPNMANHIIKRPHKIKMMEKTLYPIVCHPFPHRLNDIVIIILIFKFLQPLCLLHGNILCPHGIFQIRIFPAPGSMQGYPWLRGHKQGGLLFSAKKWSNAYVAIPLPQNCFPIQ